MANIGRIMSITPIKHPLKLETRPYKISAFHIIFIAIGLRMQPLEMGYIIFPI